MQVKTKMAASMRLRLQFDGSVCTQISPRKCWFLVNLDNCNVVADLEYLIRERFELDRGLKIYLYLDGFLLPSMEKIHVIRDNDSLWVKLNEIEDHFLQRLDDSSTSSSEPNVDKQGLFHQEQKQKRTKSITRKRKSSPSLETSRRKQESSKLVNDVGPRGVGGDGCGLQTGKNQQHRKKHSVEKKRKISHPDGRLETPSKFSTTADNVSKNKGLKTGSSNSRDKPNKILSSQESQKVVLNTKGKKKRKSKGRNESLGSAVEKERPSEKLNDLSKSSKVFPQSASKIGSSANEDSDKQSNGSSPTAVVKSSATLPIRNTAEVGPAIPSPSRAENGQSSVRPSSAQEGSTHSVGRKKKLKPVCLSAGHIRFESSSDSDSSLEEDSDKTNEDINRQQTNKEQISKEMSSTNTQEETPTTDQLLTENRTTEKSTSSPAENHVPDIQPPPNGQFPNKGQFQKYSSPSPRGGYSARGRGFVEGNRKNWDKKKQLETKQSNRSIVIQNSPPEPEIPPKDFSSFPPLVGPPRQGDVIAYKILELSESYCPELSEFKEAKVLSVDNASGQVEVELNSVAMATRAPKPGKFDLQWDQPEDTEGVCDGETNQDLSVSLQLRDLVDPRLVPSTST